MRVNKIDHAMLVWEKQYPDNNTEKQSQIINVRVYPEGVSPAYINYSRGETINIGNYESTKISVSVTLPCVAEELTQAAKQAVKFVEDKLAEELDNISEAYGLNEVDQ